MLAKRFLSISSVATYLCVVFVAFPIQGANADEAFNKMLVDKSPWLGDWSIGTSKGTYELTFMMDGENLAARVDKDNDQPHKGADGHSRSIFWKRYSNPCSSIFSEKYSSILVRF